MSQTYICVEGNIGSGKTTFANRYAELTGATAIYEQFSQNPFLELFYKNPKQFAFPLEMSFLAERFQQLNDIFSKPDLFTKQYVADYSFLKTLIFAKNNLQPEEFQLFKSFYSILNTKLPKPDLILYLHTESNYAEKNIVMRGRAYEQVIEKSYLESINRGYKDILLTKIDLPIVLLPYDENSWEKLDETIFNFQNQLNMKVLKNGLQLF